MELVQESEKLSLDHLNVVFSDDEAVISKLIGERIIKINAKGEFSFDYVGVIVINDKASFS